jgi:hypothetical protein
MRIAWQKKYRCWIREGSHDGLKATLLGVEVPKGTGVQPPHVDWGPAEVCHCPPYTCLLFGNCRGPAFPRVAPLQRGDSVAPYWSVFDGSCQLARLVWEDGTPVPCTVSLGTIPGGGAAAYDKHEQQLTIAITNDQEDPTGDSRGIDLSRIGLAIFDRAPTSRQFHTIFDRLSRGGAKPRALLDWHPLTKADRLAPASPVPVRGHRVTDFLRWPQSELPVGRYTAFRLNGIPVGAGVLMHGALSDGAGSPVLFWAEHIALRGR